MRSSGFLAIMEFFEGQLANAWAINVSSLPKASTLPRNTMRSYQFVYGMATIADRLGLRWAKQGLSEGARDFAAATGNLQILAEATEKLAMAYSDIREDKAAQQTFQLAEQQLSNLGKSKASSLYEADWQTDRARMAEQKGDLNASLRQMEDSQSQFANLNVFETKMAFLDEHSRLLRKLNRPKESLSIAWAAIVDAELRLSGMNNNQKRQGWREQTHSVYDTAILDLIALGKTREALTLWNLLRSADFRSVPIASSPDTDIELALNQAEMATSASPIAFHQKLIYALLDEKYVIWMQLSVQDHRIVVRQLSTEPQSIKHVTDTLLELTSDPQSSLQDIKAVGSMAYSDLLSPIEEYLHPSETIELDLDPSLQHISFATLVSNGNFLGLQHQIIYLQRTPKKTETQTPESAGLRNSDSILILRQRLNKALPTINSDFDESIEVSKQFPDARKEEVTIKRVDNEVKIFGSPTLSSALRKANVLHYTGHEVDQVSQPLHHEPNAANQFTLGSGSLGRCQLAVLAACRTASKRENSSSDVPSLVRQFLDAGVHSVLATQWEIDSRATQRIMVDFYGQLALKQSFSTALQHAQLKVASTPQTEHPFYWAPFQLVQELPISQKGRH